MLNIWVLLGTFIISFALSTLLFIWFIPILRKQKIGQKIHQKKGVNFDPFFQS